MFWEPYHGFLGVSVFRPESFQIHNKPELVEWFVHIETISVYITDIQYHVRVLCVRTKANFLFVIYLCGRCMFYTRKGMLRDSYIFKSFGFLLFFIYFTCVLLSCCYSPLVTVLSLLCIIFLFLVLLIPLDFSFFYGSFEALYWAPRYDGQNWLRFLFERCPVQISPGTPTTLTKKTWVSTVLAGKCHDRTLNFASIASFSALSNALHKIVQ